MPPEANPSSVPSKDDSSVGGGDADAGSFDAFVSYLSGNGAPPPIPPPPASSTSSPPLDIEEAALLVVGGGGDDAATDDDDGSESSLAKVKAARGGEGMMLGSTMTSTAHESSATGHPIIYPVHPNNKKYPPSLFTNDRGNLKAVAFVVRRPCAVFTSLVVLCVLVSFLLQVMVFRTAENGVPFTPPANEFDLSDVRSVQYDSYRLARDEVSGARKANEDGDKVTPRQSEVAAIAMWVFESEEVGDDDPGNDGDGRGVFGSAESIAAMKAAYDIFLSDPGYAGHCLLDYRAWPGMPGGGAADDATAEEEEGRKCIPPLTPLSMYYASEWDAEMVSAVINELKDPSKLEMFNSLALCFARGQYCEQVIDDVSPEDAIWATVLTSNITSITSKFDMGGGMVEDYDQVTELASYLIKVDVFKGFVDYGFDLGFSAENPVSQ